MKVLITGASGLIGTAFGEHLSVRGHIVGGLSRQESSKDSPYWDPKEGVIRLGRFDDADVVIHLAGESIAEGRWTQAKKDRILRSRVNGTKLLSEHLAQARRKPKVLISGSAIGIYGDQGRTVLDERSELGNDFLADVCRQWEEATHPASVAGIRVIHARIGMVLSASGGALQKMLPPFRMGLGGRLGNGMQYMSWVSLEDLVAMVEYVMEKPSISGAVNLVAPNPVLNEAFTKILGRVLHRPTLFPVPGFALRALLGEMADALLLSSARVMPQALMDAGFSFRHAELEHALRSTLKLQR